MWYSCHCRFGAFPSTALDDKMISFKSQTPAFRTRQSLYCAIVSAICLFAAGCGSAKYEERLGATAKMFNHQHELDEHLQDWYEDEMSIVRIRPPRGFGNIPEPKPVEADDGTMEYPPLDGRQPPFLNEELPGMVAAWKSEVTAEDMSGTAYLYILSDLAMSGDEELGFRDAVLDVLDRDLDTDLSGSSFNQMAYPQDSSQGYVRPVVYEEETVVPEGLVNELPTEFTIYMHETDAAQLCLIFVMPEKANSAQAMLDRLRFSLETLEVVGGSDSSGDGESGEKRGGGGF